MTVWKAGMLAVCVRRPDGPIPSVWEPDIGNVYLCLGTEICPEDGDLLIHLAEDPDKFNGTAWQASAFRPAVDDREKADADFLEDFGNILKRSKPALAPNRHELTGY